MTTTIALANRTFPPKLADLGFSMDVPEGFIEAELPGQDINFDDPTKSAAIAVLSSPVALAVIAVAARPAYSDGTVLQWMRYLAGHSQLELQHVLVRTVGKGDGHPGISAFGVQYQEGTQLHFMLTAFEDGGRLVIAHAMCPAELWPSYGAVLSASVESITLTNPKGPTHPVDDLETRQHAAENNRAAAEAQIEESKQIAGGRAAAPEDKATRQDASDPIQRAIFAAREHLRSDLFDDAEREILTVDSSIQGSVKLMRLYEEHLRNLVDSADKDNERTERVFYRALSWAQSCYPEPHTECEAEDYAKGRTGDRANLVGVLGYDPDASSKRS